MTGTIEGTEATVATAELASPAAAPAATTTPAASAPIATEGAGTLRRVGDVDVLCVRGTFREMGYQHGALLATKIPLGPLPYYREYVQRLLGRGPVGSLAWTAIQRILGGKVAKALPDYATETLRGLAEGSQIPYQQVLEGATLPDALLWLAARMMQLRQPGPAVRHRIALGMGCTSALAWGPATRDGKLYHARNFDYHGVRVWPRTKAVIFHDPAEGQRYVSAAAAGIPLGGATAMNEAGLTLTVHQHMFTDRTAFGGTPIGVVGDEVMRKAETLADAERILAEHPPIGCWTYLVASGREGAVLCFEQDPKRQVAIRREGSEDPTFGYTNIYLDPELGRTEVNLYGSYWRHNLGRYQRVNERLREERGSLDAPAMAAILGDTGDPRCRIRGSIAMVMTVGSTVFCPEDGLLWVGTGEAPTSRGGWLPFSLETQRHAPDAGAFTVGAGSGAGDASTEADRAFDRYRQALIAYAEDRDPGGAQRHLERATALAPEQPVYHALRGLLAITVLDAAAAETAFDRAIGLGHPDPERVAGFHLWRARARDLLGRRDEATLDYRAALGHGGDAPVERAARRGLRRRFTPRRAKRVRIDFAFGDVVDP